MIRQALFGALVLAALTAVGAATPREAVLGSWSFRTDPYAPDCQMTGQILVKPTTKPGVFSCRLKALETCGKSQYRAEETCTLTETNGAVTINSSLTYSSVPYYAPDDFTLRVESVSRMRGQLRSAGVVAPVLFYRGPDMIS